MFLYDITKNPPPQQSYKDPISLVFYSLLGNWLKNERN